MNAVEICRQLDRGLSPLFTCSEHNGYVRIRTPFLYPDGDVLDLFCRTQGHVVTVSDLGETMRWLRMQTPAPRRSAKQRALIEDVCLTHGVELYRGMLQARCRPGDAIAGVVLRVAEAALRVADLWFTFRTRGVESVTDEVADYLTEHQLSFERGTRLRGRSGRTWTVDFHVRAPARSSLVHVLTTGSRSAARTVVAHVVTSWYDLNHLAVGPEALRFVSLFDDAVDVWSEEDFKLVGELSTVTRWSRPDDFLAVLLTA